MDALSDLVILRNGPSLPTVFMTPAPMTFTVTNTNTIGPGSLRQAILDANANPGAASTRSISSSRNCRKICSNSALAKLMRWRCFETAARTFRASRC